MKNLPEIRNRETKKPLQSLAEMCMEFIQHDEAAERAFDEAKGKNTLKYVESAFKAKALRSEIKKLSKSILEGTKLCQEQ